MARDLISGDKALKALKEADSKRLGDGGGLYLLPNVNGGSHGWRFDYTFKGKRKTLSLGVYPDVGLAAARKMAQEFRTLVATGVSPSEQRKTERRKEKETQEAEKLLKKGELTFIPGILQARCNALAALLEKSLGP